MKALILKPTPENIARASEALLAEQVVAMPTETVYGLAGAAFRPEALARIFDTKERPTFDPLILHIAPLNKACEISDLENLKLVNGKALGEKARRRAELLMRAFWPGPLTLVLPKHPDVPDLATSGLPTVAIRMPRHPVAQALLKECKTPLAAPSANRFGRISPTTAQAVADELGDRIGFILDGGSCEIGLESTVLSIEPDGQTRLLRPGGISKNEVEKLIGEPVLSVNAETPLSAAVPSPAPGMLESHYAPSKPFLILPGPVFDLHASQFKELLLQRQLNFPQKAGLLLFSNQVEKARSHLSAALACPVTARSLTQRGDMHEAARLLFAEMRSLDQSDVDVIFAEPCPVEQGLGHAIADRMRRAGAKKSTPHS
jgi:L-threonylcarbamoyladenylate synthase